MEIPQRLNSNNMVFILIIIVVYLYLIFPGRHPRQFHHRKYTHRGYHSQDQSVKENTLEAFQFSKEKGYGIELDVQLNQSGDVVVYHDFNLKRLEDVESFVFDLTQVELQQYQIPTLKEVLRLINGEIGLIIELKSDKNRNQLCRAVYEILKAYNGPICIESFDPRIVYWFRKHAPEIKRGQLIMPVRNYGHLGLGVFINSLLYQFLTRPHFLAINVNSLRYNPSIKINQLFGVESCLWTVHETHTTNYKWVDAFIFEYFDA